MEYVELADGIKTANAIIYRYSLMGRVRFSRIDLKHGIDVFKYSKTQ